MAKSSKGRTIPAVNGPQVYRLLRADGWMSIRDSPHGWFLAKRFSDYNRRTTIPKKRRSLPLGTLSKILGPQQTNIGKKGLARLIDKYGLSKSK